MKVLVLGAAGMLGFALHRVLRDSGCDVIGAVRAAQRPDSNWCRGLDYVCGVDVENFAGVVRTIQETCATVVINATGVRLSGGSDDQRRLFAVNAMFPRLLGSVASSLDIHFIHFSSDGVFDGKRGMHDESCAPDATDSYGMSKFLGEPVDECTLVLRTSMIGCGIASNQSLVDWLLRQSGPVRGFRRSVFSGLPVNEIARVLVGRVLPRPEPLTGLFHLAAAPITKYELLQLLRSAWQLDHVRIVPDDGVVIDRSLDSGRLRETISYVPAAWDELIAGMRSFYRALGEVPVKGGVSAP